MRRKSVEHKFAGPGGAALVMVLMSLLFMGGIAAIFSYWLQMESRHTAREAETLQDRKAMESAAQAEIQQLFHASNAPPSPSSYTWTNLPIGTRTYIVDGVTVTATISPVGVQSP